MLRPRDTPTRERRALNQAVAVRFDADGAVRRDGWFDGRYATPARYPCRELQRPLRRRRVRDHVRDTRYQTTVRVPAGHAERRR
jgi:beta-glucuronidase